jgi:IS605 OrfB family transposase
VVLSECEAEASRQHEARRTATGLALASGRVDEKGRPKFTAEERASFRLAAGARQALSPTLVVSRKGISFNLPVESAVEVVKAEDGRVAGLHQRVVTVDINTFNVAVTAWNGDRILKTAKLSYGAIQSNRERQVGRAIAQSRQCAGRNHGERQSVRLWEQVRDQGETCARQAAAWITGFAQQHGATVIVVEHLGRYRPIRGTRSRRANRRRSYWLRGRIREYTQDAALANGILTVQRNPAWTSQQCPRCHRLGERFSESRANPDNKSRFRCLNSSCGWTGDADIAASMNLHRKWTRTFTWPSADEITVHRQRSSNLKTPRRRGASGTPNPPGNRAPAPPCRPCSQGEGKNVA